jgi:hypothetical protein
MKIKTKVPLWLFILTLILAITFFVKFGKSNLDQQDEIYGLYAQQLYLNIEILDYLKNKNFNKAKEVLEGEIDSLAPAVAICLMNDCSKKAKSIIKNLKTK